MNKLYKIPFCYEEGCYLLKDICVPDNISDSECMILEYEEDCDIISNNINQKFGFLRDRPENNILKQAYNIYLEMHAMMREL